MEQGESLAGWASGWATWLVDGAAAAAERLLPAAPPTEAGLVAAGIGLILLLPTLAHRSGLVSRSFRTVSRHRPPRHRRGRAIPARPARPNLPPPVTAPAFIIDGDTVVVARQRIRLHGIDAPEMDQRGGAAARAHLAKLIAGRRVTTAPLDVDVYGRTVARVLVEGHDICAAMVADGYAIAYRRYSTAYVWHERRARLRRRGLWADSGIMCPAAHRFLTRRPR